MDLKNEASVEVVTAVVADIVIIKQWMYPLFIVVPL